MTEKEFQDSLDDVMKTLNQLKRIDNKSKFWNHTTYGNIAILLDSAYATLDVAQDIYNKEIKRGNVGV